MASQRGAQFEPIIVLAVHGDLANAVSLKESTYVQADSSVSGLFFTVKGAVVLLDDHSGKVDLLHCAVYADRWVKVAPVTT